MPSCIILGITGGVASGKSTVAGILGGLGAARVSADEIARELLAPDAAVTRAVLEEFGAEVALEGAELVAVDRKKLAARIYADDRARKKLGEIMHPPIRAEMRRQIKLAKAQVGCRMVAAEIPLLYENGLEGMVDRVLVASCLEEFQRERLQARQPWLSADEALQQIRSQMPLDEKARRADYVIQTDQPIEAETEEVKALFERLMTERSL